MDERLEECRRWAEEMVRLGLLREDQVEEAAALRAAMGAAEAGQGRRLSWEWMPRHRLMRAVERLKERVRGGKGARPPKTCGTGG